MRLAIASLGTALAIGVLAGCGDDSDEGEPGQTVTSGGADFRILGTWEGELRQKRLAPFRVTATIGDLDDPAANTVHYTGIDCGGNWTFLGGATVAATKVVGEVEITTSTTRYPFREVINRGAGGECKGVGKVTLTPTGANRVFYEFRGGGVESTGVLSRVD